MVNEEYLLNQGRLAPVDVRIPKGSFLSPSEKAAVVGGNVLTSQRVTDVVFRCFEACAASQGDCNNLTFGYGGTWRAERGRKGLGIMRPLPAEVAWGEIGRVRVECIPI